MPYFLACFTENCIHLGLSCNMMYFHRHDVLIRNLVKIQQHKKCKVYFYFIYFPILGRERRPTNYNRALTRLRWPVWLNTAKDRKGLQKNIIGYATGNWQQLKSMVCTVKVCELRNENNCYVISITVTTTNRLSTVKLGPTGIRSSLCNQQRLLRALTTFLFT